MQDEAARACIELLRAEGHTTSSALQTTEFDCPVDTSMTILQVPFHLILQDSQLFLIIIIYIFNDIDNS